MQTFQFISRFLHSSDCFLNLQPIMSALVKKTALEAPGTSAAEPSAQSSSQHLCCLCSATLPSKEDLQDHFRLDNTFIE
jgi:hypothetical protein